MIWRYAGPKGEVIFDHRHNGAICACGPLAQIVSVGPASGDHVRPSLLVFQASVLPPAINGVGEVEGGSGPGNLQQNSGTIRRG